MGFLNSVFGGFKRKSDESTVDFLGRVCDAVKVENGEHHNDFSLVDEAEVYFAYGRIQQGLEIIHEALRLNPQDPKALEYIQKYSNVRLDDSSVKYQAPESLKIMKKYLVSVIANVDGNTFPQNFEIVSEHNVKETKEGQDFLKQKINEQGYNSWGLLSVVELKE